MISAATPATAGEAMLVPAPNSSPVARAAAAAWRMTMSNTQQNCTIEPLGLRGNAHTALQEREVAAARCEVDSRLAEVVYDAGRRKFVAPVAKPSGPVAETAITCGDIAA